LEELQRMHQKSFEESLADSRRYADVLKQIYLYSGDLALKPLHCGRLRAGVGLRFGRGCPFCPSRLYRSEDRFVAAVVSGLWRGTWEKKLETSCSLRATLTQRGLPAGSDERIIDDTELLRGSANSAGNCAPTVLNPSEPAKLCWLNHLPFG
jgi:hypothetical protein